MDRAEKHNVQHLTTPNKYYNEKTRIFGRYGMENKWVHGTEVRARKTLTYLFLSKFSSINSFRFFFLMIFAS